MNPTVERAHIERIADMIRAEHPDDGELLLDCLESETGLFELSGRLLEAMEADEGNVSALDAQIAVRQDRKAAAKARIDRARGIVLDLMIAANIDKLPLPEATITRRMGKPTLSVADETAVPDDFTETVRKVDKRKINEAFADGELPNWLTRTDPKPVLTVRRK